MAPAFEENIDFGWFVFGVISKYVISPIFHFLEGFIGNYGLIIVILVLLVKTVLFPLSYKSYVSMAKMKVLKPELDEIKERNGDDMQAAQKEQMQLYGKVGVNPISGCVPMLLQMPVLLAMFNFFPNSIELRQEPFLWTDDLSTYDSIFSLPFEIPFYGDHVSLFVILMTLSTILYTWSNNQATSVQGPMKSIQYFMPVILMFVLNSFPAALSFYYFCSNIITFGQQAIIRRFVDDEKIHKKLQENKLRNKDKKKSKFQARIEEAMKASQEKQQERKGGSNGSDGEGETEKGGKQKTVDSRFVASRSGNSSRLGNEIYCDHHPRPMTEVKDVKIRKKKRLGSYPYVSVVFSITMALFVIGLFGLLLLHANALSRVIRENVEVQIFLNQTISENDRLKIQKMLATKEYIAEVDGEQQTSYISKEEAAEDFIQDAGEDFRQFLGENPLHDAFVIRIKPEYYTAEALQKVKLDVERLSGVFEVAYVENLVKSINENLTKISLVLMGFALLLVLIVTVLINNTIRLALFSQRFLIRSMQLVGATARFIQRPFLARSFAHGLLGGVLASVLLILILQYANQQIEDIEQLQDPFKIAILLTGLLILGGALGFVSTYRAVKRYMGMSLDELY